MGAKFFATGKDLVKNEGSLGSTFSDALGVVAAGGVFPVSVDARTRPRFGAAVDTGFDEAAPRLRRAGIFRGGSSASLSVGGVSSEMEEAELT